MKKIIGLLIIALFSFKTLNQSTWTLDEFHSQLGFSISMMDLSDVTGNFKIKESVINAPNEDFTGATVTMVADAASINTGIPDRDAHLRTADFFDTDKYPTITFKSNPFKKTGENKYEVTGELTMHGITRPVTLEAIGKQATHPVTNGTIAGFRVSGTIKRSDFVISPSTPPSMLSDEVKVIANLQFNKK